jgi:hypothetical protein
VAGCVDTHILDLQYHVVGIDPAELLGHMLFEGAVVHAMIFRPIVK